MNNADRTEYLAALETFQAASDNVQETEDRILATRQYQADYKQDLESLADVEANQEKIVRTRKFMEQLGQMELDQISKLITLRHQKSHAATRVSIQAQRAGI